MAHRIYHGKTGVVWNITQRAVGVLLKKQVGPRFGQRDSTSVLNTFVPLDAGRTFFNVA